MAERSIGYYRGPLERVLVGIDRAGLEGAVLTLDGDCDDLKAFVEERTRAHPEIAESNRKVRGRRGFLGIRFSGGPLNLPIEGSNLRDLIAMLEHHADPEIAIEVGVVRGHDRLVWAPDVGNNEIWVTEGLSDAARTALVEALGGGLAAP